MNRFDLRGRPTVSYAHCRSIPAANKRPARPDYQGNGSQARRSIPTRPNGRRPRASTSKTVRIPVRQSRIRGTLLMIASSLTIVGTTLLATPAHADIPQALWPQHSDNHCHGAGIPADLNCAGPYGGNDSCKIARERRNAQTMTDCSRDKWKEHGYWYYGWKNT